MNVLYLINYAGKAGTEKYVENLVRILGKDKIKPFFAYNIPGELSKKMESAGIPCLQLDLSWKRARTSAKRLADYCRENSIDVIHAQYPRENVIALMSKKWYDKPRVVLTNHLTLRLSGASGKVWRRINRRYTPKNHCIIAVCNEGKDILIENGVPEGKIKVIYNGIEPSEDLYVAPEKREELGLDEDCFIISILARFDPEKGLSFLLDALAELKRMTDKPFCCLICGDGELMDDIRRKRDELGLQDECRLLGFRRDVREILLSSHVYVCSSSHNEAMSFAILEAMDCGLPLVVTDVGGNRDLAATDMACGFVVPYGDKRQFAEKLLVFMEDECARDDMSRIAREKAHRYFDLNKLALDVYNAYF